jgi:hypothetical protein
MILDVIWAEKLTAAYQQLPSRHLGQVTLNALHFCQPESSMIKDIITHMGNRVGDGFGARRAGSVVFGDFTGQLDE